MIPSGPLPCCRDTGSDSGRRSPELSRQHENRSSPGLCDESSGTAERCAAPPGHSRRTRTSLPSRHRTWNTNSATTTSPSPLPDRHAHPLVAAANPRPHTANGCSYQAGRTPCPPGSIEDRTAPVGVITVRYHAYRSLPFLPLCPTPSCTAIVMAVHGSGRPRATPRGQPSSLTQHRIKKLRLHPASLCIRDTHLQELQVAPSPFGCSSRADARAVGQEAGSLPHCDDHRRPARGRRRPVTLRLRWHDPELGGGSCTASVSDPAKGALIHPLPLSGLLGGFAPSRFRSPGRGRYLWRRSHAARASAASAVSRHCWTSSRERAYAVVKSVSKDDRASSLVAWAAAWGTRL